MTDPTQIKSATANTGEFSADNDNIRYSLAQDILDTRVKPMIALAMQSDANTSWITPFNTQYHKPEKWAADGKTRFKKLFDLGQRFL